MDPKFAKVIDNTHESFEKLVNTPPMKSAKLIPQAGVYLFTENGRHLYVGRSNRMRLRYGEHRRPKSPHNHASFADRMTRVDLNIPSPTYAEDEGKKQRADPIYEARFRANILRVREMQFRCVEESDQPRQFLLEFYCAVALETPYNYFETH